MIVWGQKFVAELSLHFHPMLDGLLASTGGELSNILPIGLCSIDKLQISKSDFAASDLLYQWKMLSMSASQVRYAWGLKCHQRIGSRDGG